MKNSGINYKVYGNQRVGIVVEMGLGACMGEWMHIAKLLCENTGVLLYERAGINNSKTSDNARSPIHIAEELYELMQDISHEDKFIIIAHSQGGLYAQQFARSYPDMVKGILLLDPLSADDDKFKDELSEKEYKQSGVDKSANLLIMHKLARLHLGFITKTIIKKAPPFYYYDGFNKEARADILNAVTKPQHCDTAWKEYMEAHKAPNIRHLKDKGDFPDIPLVLITHTSQLAVEESMKFGNNTREFAEKIEEMWQRIMANYLSFSNTSTWIRAKSSSHYIHLTETQLLLEGVEWINANI